MRVCLLDPIVCEFYNAKVYCSHALEARPRLSHLHPASFTTIASAVAATATTTTAAAAAAATTITTAGAGFCAAPAQPPRRSGAARG
eukprot:4735049-Pleurochrysis_carterae.AAC.2